MLRRVFRHPIQILIQVLSLSIGLAACLAAWSTVDALSFSAIPGIHERARLVRVRWASDQSLVSPRELAAGEPRLEDALGPLAVEGILTKPVETPAGAMTLRIAFVSSGYFGTLGTTPLAGRLLSPTDARSPAAPAGVVSDALWQRAFDRHAIDGSETLRVAGQVVAVVGVAPAGFPGLSPRDVVLQGSSSAGDLWLPAASARTWHIAPSPDAPWLMLAGRPAAGRPFAGVRAEVESVATTMAAVSRDRHEPILNVYASGADWSDDLFRASMVSGLFLFLPLCILGVGCANTINLQLARAHERSQELAIRRALGCSRGRLVRLMAFDTVVIAASSGLASVVATRAIVTWSEGALELPLSLHATGYAFAALLAAGVVALAGIVPAWMATRDVGMPGARAESTDGVRHRRLRLSLVILQLVVCTALLFMSAMGVRSLLKLSPVPGLGADRTAVIDVRLDDIHPGQVRAAAFTTTVLDRLAAEPGVEAAGLADFLVQPHGVAYSLPGGGPGRRFALGGSISANWITAMGLPLVSGRRFTAADGPNVALVNRQLAAGIDARQADLLVGASGVSSTRVSVVGVVDTPGLPPDRPMVFLPMPRDPPASVSIVVRGRSATVARAALRDAVSAADPLVPVDRIDTLATAIGRQGGGLEQIVSVGGVISLAAMLIAAAGIYSLMAYSVERRTREIGIRMAIGAGRAAILRLVGREAVLAYGVGAGTGLAVGVGVATLMRAALFGLSPIDPRAFWPVALGLLAVTVLASAVPTLAATRITPLQAVRER